MADPSFRLDLDLASLGIDAEQTFEGLLSPSGTVNEWALSITLTTMMTIGFVIAGLIFQYFKSTNPSATALLDYFEVHFGSQAVFTTVVRGFLNIFYQLFSRTVTTFLLFGISTAVTEILSTSSVLSVWQFVSSSALGEIMSWRFLVGAISVILQFPILSSLSSFVSEAIQG